MKGLFVVCGVLMLTALASGCNGSCTLESVEGAYSMSADAHVYKLHVARGGLGTLSRDGQAEDITWDWENEQVFLNVTGDLAKEMLVLAVHPSVRESVPKSDKVYLGLVTECQSGFARRLNLRQGDNPPHFSRSE